MPCYVQLFRQEHVVKVAELGTNGRCSILGCCFLGGMRLARLIRQPLQEHRPVRQTGRPGYACSQKQRELTVPAQLTETIRL